MPLDFTPTSVVKRAKRTYTAPITDAQTFDNAIADLKSEDNPLGATDYMTAGETIPGVSTASEYYKATIEYTDTLGETLGTIVITAPTRTAYDDIIAELLAATAITQAYGSDTATNRNTAKDSWNVRLKIHDPTGEIYYLSFTRKALKITPYENDNKAARSHAYNARSTAEKTPDSASPKKKTGATQREATTSSQTLTPGQAEMLQSTNRPASILMRGSGSPTRNPAGLNRRGSLAGFACSDAVVVWKITFPSPEGTSASRRFHPVGMRQHAESPTLG